MCDKKKRHSLKTFWSNVRDSNLKLSNRFRCPGCLNEDYCLDGCPYGPENLADPCKFLLTPVMKKRSYSNVKYMKAFADLFFAVTEWEKDDPRTGLDKFVVSVDSSQENIILSTFCDVYWLYHSSFVRDCTYRDLGIKVLNINSIPALKKAVSAVSSLASEFLKTPEDTRKKFEKNQTVVLNGKYHFKEGSEFCVEGYWEDIFGKSWMDSTGNPCAVTYGIRCGHFNIPIDNNVLYGKINGIGYLIHTSEIVEK